ncbi:MAG: prepilin-type N-terminal cleavage/methylation domain-containing protein [Hyphomonas sp.]
MPREHIPVDHPSAKPEASAQAGLSLVEVLVTLSISALAATLIMTTARPADPLRTEGERLTQTLEQLDGRARVSGAPTGLVVDPGRYTGVVWTGEEWSALPRQAHSLARGVAFQFPVGHSAGSRERDEKHPTPILVFDPLGHSTLQPLVLHTKDRELTVSSPAASPGSKR